MKAIITFCLLMLLTFASFAEDKRSTLPPEAETNEAKVEISGLYEDEIKAAKTAEDFIKLSEEFLKLGISTNDQLSGKYGLYLLAQDYAIQSGKPALLDQVLKQISAEFKVEYSKILAAALPSLARVSENEDISDLLTMYKTAIDASLYTNEYEQANDLCNRAITFARRLRDAERIKPFTDLRSQITKAEELFAVVKEHAETLKTNPSDGKANTAMGKFLCFVKGNWEKGLKHLEQGDDDTLSALAMIERNEVKDENIMVLADGWWKAADQYEGQEQEQMKARAALWYEKALPKLTGLTKLRIDKRVKEAPKMLNLEKPTVDTSVASAGAAKPAKVTSLLGKIKDLLRTSVGPFTAKEDGTLTSPTILNGRATGYLPFPVKVNTTNTFKMKVKITPNSGQYFGVGIPVSSERRGTRLFFRVQDTRDGSGVPSIRPTRSLKRNADGETEKDANGRYVYEERGSFSIYVPSGNAEKEITLDVTWTIKGDTLSAHIKCGGAELKWTAERKDLLKEDASRSAYFTFNWLNTMSILALDVSHGGVPGSSSVASKGSTKEKKESKTAVKKVKYTASTYFKTLLRNTEEEKLQGWEVTKLGLKVEPRVSTSSSTIRGSYRYARMDDDYRIPFKPTGKDGSYQVDVIVSGFNEGNLEFEMPVNGENITVRFNIGSTNYKLRRSGDTFSLGAAQPAGINVPRRYTVALKYNSKGVRVQAFVDRKNYGFADYALELEENRTSRPLMLDFYMYDYLGSGNSEVPPVIIKDIGLKGKLEYTGN